MRVNRQIHSKGKSTVSSLGYSMRLEKLFIELREELAASSSKQKQAGASSLVLSLPCLKPIDAIFNQSTNATTTNSMASAVFNEKSPGSVVEEKENTLPPFKSNKKSENRESGQPKKLGIIDFLLNEASSSESVPVAKLLGSTATKPPLPSYSEQVELTTSFVFSPIGGKNSFLAPKSQAQSSLSASKAESSSSAQF